MAPFRSRNTGFNASSSSSFSSLPLSSSWDRSDSDSDSKKRASKHSRSNPQFRGFDDLRRRWPSRGFRRKGLSAMSEGDGFQKRERRDVYFEPRSGQRALYVALEPSNVATTRRGRDIVVEFVRGRKPRIGQRSKG